MHRQRMLIILGVLIALAPYLGLPYGWLMFLLPLLGIIVLSLGLSLRIKRRAPLADETPSHEAERAV